MKAFVTGASGFIGRALCTDLRRRGHHVTAAVRNASASVDADRVVQVPDLTSTTRWDGLLDGIDVVFHLAGFVHVLDRAASLDLEAFREVNARGTETLAIAAARAGVQRFVFFSTIAIYGAEAATPLREDDPPHAVTPYGISKREGEDQLIAACRGTGMRWTILRPPLVYGPGVRAKFLQLVNFIGRGVPLPFGLVRNRRSFAFLGNLVDAAIVASTHDAAADEVFFIADAETWSTPDLVRALARAMDRSPRLLPVPHALLALLARITGQRERLVPLLGSMVIDTGKFTRATGWTPPFSAEEGFRRTVERRRDAGVPTARLPR